VSVTLTDDETRALVALVRRHWSLCDHCGEAPCTRSVDVHVGVAVASWLTDACDECASKTTRHCEWCRKVFVGWTDEDSPRCTRCGCPWSTRPVTIEDLPDAALVRLARRLEER
jgi:hypothetical protein